MRSKSAQILSQSKPNSQSISELINYSRDLRISGEFDQAKKVIIRALRLAINQSDRIQTARCYCHEAIIYSEKQDYPKANRCFEKANTHLLPKDDLYRSLLANWAAVLQAMGKFDEAIEMQKKVNRIFVELGLTNTADFANNTANLSHALYEAHRFHEAETVVLSAIELMDQNPREALMCIRVLYIAAYHRFQVQEFEKTEILLKKYFSICRDPSIDPLSYVTCLAMLAFCRQVLTNSIEGRDLSNDFFNLYEKLPSTLKLNTSLIQLYGLLLI